MIRIKDFIFLIVGYIKTIAVFTILWLLVILLIVIIFGVAVLFAVCPILITIPTGEDIYLLFLFVTIPITYLFIFKSD